MRDLNVVVGLSRRFSKFLHLHWLMVVTIVAKVDIHVTDEPLYFSESSDTSSLLTPGTASSTSSTDQIANQLLNKLNKGQKK